MGNVAHGQASNSQLSLKKKNYPILLRGRKHPGKFISTSLPHAFQKAAPKYWSCMPKFASAPICGAGVHVLCSSLYDNLNVDHDALSRTCEMEKKPHSATKLQSVFFSTLTGTMVESFL